MASTENYAYNTLTDAGIVQVDGRTYLMCIMCGLPDCAENRALFCDLAESLFAVRGSLSWQ